MADKVKLTDTVTMTNFNTDFDRWLRLVGAVVFKKTGMDWEDVLGDYMHRDAYESGVSVYDCAMDIIDCMRDEAESMGFGEAF